MIVEYLNTDTNELEQFITQSLNSSSFTYLASLDVTVYVLPDGTAWATDFKRINKLSDSVKNKQNSKHKKQVD